MKDILALLQPIQNSVSKTTLRQLSRIIVAMIAMTGRVTMLGLSRWTGKGGSYRSVQRFFCTAIPWAQVFWVFFQVSFSAFSQSGCFRPHSSCQRACFFRLIGEGIVIGEIKKNSTGSCTRVWHKSSETLSFPRSAPRRCEWRHQTPLPSINKTKNPFAVSPTLSISPKAPAASKACAVQSSPLAS